MSGDSGSRRLKWWVCFSGVLHLVLLAMLLLVPPSTARRDALPRVYTVDLVAPGPAPAVPEPPKPAEAPPAVEAAPREQVKETPAPKEEEPPALTEPTPPEKPEKKVVEPPPPAPPKKVAKPKKKPTPKPKVVKRAKPAPKKTAAKKPSKKPSKKKKKVSRKPPSKKTPKLAKKEPKRKSGAGSASKLVERLRKRRIDDAVAVARERARLQRAARREGGGGSGASGNGGVVRGVEFLAYHHQMLNRIKDRWTWIGKRGDLEVTVGFGVGVDGKIFGLKLLKFSGDASFDESVVRAVDRSSPLPPPPTGYVRDFAQVEITFRPADLGG
ncbi:MAG: energy transducer TonB [Deltaproteobacteria bacterium]|nr:energy transducer TonB [Deltaproteobacteria bacterium]